VLLAVWRRIVKEGGGPELTLPEAAVLLGTSVESVRRRIKAGKISAFYDDRGRVRIHASLPSGAAAQAIPPNLAGLWDELKTAKSDLAAAASEAQQLRHELNLAHFHRREAQQDLEGLQNQSLELQEELETARQALEHTQNELASMWRVMSSRRERTEPGLTSMTDGNEAFDLPPSLNSLASERSRIQSQITRIRDLSKRRRWPWPQAS
jgi:excisionase family DNA binding protein